MRVSPLRCWRNCCLIVGCHESFCNPVPTPGTATVGGDGRNSQQGRGAPLPASDGAAREAVFRCGVGRDCGALVVRRRQVCDRRPLLVLLVGVVSIPEEKFLSCFS